MSMLVLPPLSKTVVQRMVLLLFVLSILGQGWSLIFCIWCLRSTVGIALLAMYFAYAWGPGWNACEDGSWPTPLRRWSLWSHFRDYFDARLVRTAPLDPAANYILVAHPHGVIALSGWVNFATEATGFGRLFPGISVRCATLAGNFRMPLIREYCLLHGLICASRRAFIKTLSRGPGSSVLVVVGGAAESLHAAPGTCDLVLARRKGFVRLALETGASLVPVLFLGENDAYDTLIPEPGSRAASAMRLFKKVFGFATPICWGSGLTGGWGMLPKRVRLTTVVGAPIPLPKVAAPPRRTGLHRYSSSSSSNGSGSKGDSSSRPGATASHIPCRERIIARDMPQGEEGVSRSGGSDANGVVSPKGSAAGDGGEGSGDSGSAVLGVTLAGCSRYGSGDADGAGGTGLSRRKAGRDGTAHTSVNDGNSQGSASDSQQRMQGGGTHAGTGEASCSGGGGGGMAVACVEEVLTEEQYDALVDRVHRQYVAALRDLWLRHRSLHESTSPKELTIVE